MLQASLAPSSLSSSPFSSTCRSMEKGFMSAIPRASRSGLDSSAGLRGGGPMGPNGEEYWIAETGLVIVFLAYQGGVVEIGWE